MNQFRSNVWENSPFLFSNFSLGFSLLDSLINFLFVSFFKKKKTSRNSLPRLFNKMFLQLVIVQNVWYTFCEL